MGKLRTSCLVMAAAAMAACGPTGAGGGGDDDTTAGADASSGGPDGGGGPGTIDASPPDDASCGAQQEDIALISLGDPPDLLIVLDRSGSMATPPGFPFGPFDPTKWDVMTDALQDTTQTYENNINFGLAVFPTDDLCGLSPGTAVSIAPQNSSSIVGAMNGMGPNGNTPAHLALQNALSVYQSIPVNSAGQYVLFATDGLPNCGGNPVVADQASETETVQAVTALANAGIKTFVLGFGDFLGSDPQVLNDAAQAGQVPKVGGPPYFYHATNAAELDAALLAIAGGIIPPSCEYELTSQPPDPDLVTVTLDGTAVPRDPNHNDGWDYHPDASTITFFGSWCTALESGSVASVNFSFGCPGPTVE